MLARTFSYEDESGDFGPPQPPIDIGPSSHSDVDLHWDPSPSQMKAVISGDWLRQQRRSLMFEGVNTTADRSDVMIDYTESEDLYYQVEDESKKELFQRCRTSSVHLARLLSDEEYSIKQSQADSTMLETQGLLIKPDEATGEEAACAIL